MAPTTRRSIRQAARKAATRWRRGRRGLIAAVTAAAVVLGGGAAWAVRLYSGGSLVVTTDGVEVEQGSGDNTLSDSVARGTAKTYQFGAYVTKQNGPFTPSPATPYTVTATRVGDWLDAATYPSAASKSTTMTFTATEATQSGTVTIFVPCDASGTSAVTVQFAGSPEDPASQSGPLYVTWNITATGKCDTSTTLGVSPASPIDEGTPFALTATVADVSAAATTRYTATGNVQFFVNSETTPRWTQALSTGSSPRTATAGGLTLPAGTYSVRAVYVGDTTHNTSTSATSTLVVNAPAPTDIETGTSLTVSSSAIHTDESVMLTATVSPSGATGDVEFFEGSESLGAGAPQGDGTWTLTKSGTDLGVGPHPAITAVFSGTGLYTDSTSTEDVSVTVSQQTSLTLTASPSPATAGGSATLTATVTPAGAVGTVTFTEGSTTVGTAHLDGTSLTGEVTALVSGLTLGGHTYAASFAPDAGTYYLPSGPATTDLTVNKIPVTVSLGVDPGSVNTRQPFDLVATVTPNAATGSVVFKDNGTAIGGTPVHDATDNTWTLEHGAITSSAGHSFTVEFTGSGNYGDDTASAASPTVTKVGTAVTLTIEDATTFDPIDTITTDGSATLSATVAALDGDGSVDDGRVVFRDASTNTILETVDVGADGDAELTHPLDGSALGAGPHTYTAVYLGDDTGIFADSDPEAPATATLTVDQVTTLALAASPSPATEGDPATLTATLTPSDAAGTVEFFEGTTSLGTADVTAGAASWPLPDLSAGSHPYGATFTPNGFFTTASGTASLAVKHATTVVLSVDSESITAPGQSATLTATVSPSGATGDVVFYDNGTEITGGVRDGDTWRLERGSFTAGGTHVYTAKFFGDDDYADSPLSDPTSLTVNQATAVAVDVDESVVTTDESANLTVVVTPADAVGTLTILEDGAPFDEVVLDGTGSGQLTYPLSGLTQGSHTYSASFAPAAGSYFLPSGPASDSLTVLAVTSVSLSVAPHASIVGVVTLTATVSPSDAVGLVRFSRSVDGGAPGTFTNLSLADHGNGVWTINDTPGNHWVTYSAEFVPTAGQPFASSRSDDVSVVGTVTTVDTPTGPLAGQPLTLTAQVTAADGSTPAGSVAFVDGTTELTGDSDVAFTDGTATLTGVTLTAGEHAITATYTPTGQYVASTGTTPTFAVLTATTTTLTIDPASSIDTLTPFTLNATVTADGAAVTTGTVAFFDLTTSTQDPIGTGTRQDTTNVWSLDLPAGSLLAGSHQIGVRYSDQPGGAYAASQVTGPLTVSLTETTTDLTVEPSAEPGKYNLIAKVHPLTNPDVLITGYSGNVEFKNGDGSDLDLEALGLADSGTWTSEGVWELDGIPVSGLGLHTFRAVYGGGTVYSGSEGVGSVRLTSVTQTVLTFSPVSPTTTQAFDLVATVTDGSGEVTTGSVTFADASGALTGTVQHTAGTNVWTLHHTAISPAGSYAFTATYSDGDSYEGSSDTESIVVRSASNDTIAPFAPWIISPFGGWIATASPLISGTAEPGSTVKVYEGNQLICTTLAWFWGNWACVPDQPLSEGNHVITATATDLAGNVSPRSWPIGFIVDTLRPNAPAQPSVTQSSGRVTLTGTAEPYSAVTVTEGFMTTCVAFAAANGSWSCTAYLFDGTHTFAVTATDAAFNRSDPTTFQVTVRTTPPAPVPWGPPPPPWGVPIYYPYYVW